MPTTQRRDARQSNGKNSRPGEGRAQQPKPPFPKQHQPRPGLEKDISPRPRYEAPRYKAAGKLEGKAALITGGDSGIGRAVALLYAREGADVAIGFLSSEQADAEETRDAIEKAGGRCLLLPGDLTDREFCHEIVDRTFKEFGRFDILVSNAAFQKRFDSIEDVTDEEFDQIFKTNIYAYFYLCRAAVKHMKPGSAIIVTSSETGLEGAEKLLPYSSTKGAINAFTKTLAMELAPRGIRCNAVAPGPVWTPLNPSDAGTTLEKVSEFGKDTLFGRPAQPEEIAPAYVFLASDADSPFITGIVLPQMGNTTAG
jgi:NAD(P)-dependent dehydrogenase (short-subunit alcohol dehydrogenase family)